MWMINCKDESSLAKTLQIKNYIQLEVSTSIRVKKKSKEVNQPKFKNKVIIHVFQNKNRT